MNGQFRCNSCSICVVSRMEENKLKVVKNDVMREPKGIHGICHISFERNLSAFGSKAKCDTHSPSTRNANSHYIK